MDILGFIFGCAASIMALLAFGAAGTAMSRAGKALQSVEEMRRRLDGLESGRGH